MRIGKLEKIKLTSSTVAGSTYNEYAAGTTYAAGDNVKVSFEADGITPRTPVEEYTAIDSSNTGNYPPDNPTHWSGLGAENRWKMFDNYVNTQTEDTTSIEVVVDSSNTNLVGFFSLLAKSVTLELSAYGSVKSTETIDLTSLPGGSWYSYFFDETVYKTSFLYDITLYAASSLKVTITYLPGEQVKCGMMAIGRQYDVGKAYYTPSIELIDYSIKETDTLGRTYLKKGNFADKINVDFWMGNGQLDAVKKILDSVRGTPTIFDCNNDTNYSSLISYGSAGALTITVPGPKKSKASIEIEGLT